MELNVFLGWSPPASSVRRRLRLSLYIVARLGTQRSAGARVTVQLDSQTENAKSSCDIWHAPGSHQDGARCDRVAAKPEL